MAEKPAPPAYDRDDKPRLRAVPRLEPLPEVTETEERAALLTLARVLLRVRDRVRRRQAQR